VADPSSGAELLAGLDDDQRAAVIAPEGLVAVIAAAGSGKTTVLTKRILHRIATGTADPRHTVAITFTREAAWELRRRLRRSGVHDDVTTGTFHATAFGLLRQRWADSGRPVPAVTGERLRLVAEVLGSGRRPDDDARSVATEIDWARARRVDPAGYVDAARAAGRKAAVSADRVAEVFAAYESLKRKRGLVDLDDLLGLLLEAIERDRTFADVIRWRFRHLHVDEAQDLNPLQHAVLEAWRGGRDDLFLVGDPAQAIYGWNGADPGLLMEVERHYPGVTVVRLPTNRRSTPQIIGLGRHLLTAADLPDGIRAARPDGPAIDLVGFPEEATEIEGIVRIVRGARPPGGGYGAIGVLARTNAQVNAIAERLRASGVPVRSRRSSSHTERALAEAAGTGGFHRLLTWASEVVGDDESTPAPATGPPEDPVADADRARRRIALLVDEFVSDTGGGDGRSFVSWVRSTGAIDDSPGETVDAVDVLTFHAAKGREWPTVVVTGFEKGLVPHGGAQRGEQRAEEIRLAYVAVTRGVDRLMISWAERRAGRATGRSPLLEGFVPDSGAPLVAPPRDLVERLRARSAPQEISPPLERLRTWRATTARLARVPERAVATDEQLTRLAALEVVDADSIGAVIGRMAAHHHAARLISVLHPADDDGE
jgi:DNA helicase II / ATP-dependent DNA helicase PcrA